MSRRLTILAAVSLLCFAGVCTLWVRSYWWSDAVFDSRADALARVWSERGRVIYMRTTLHRGPVAPLGRYFGRWPVPPAPPRADSSDPGIVRDVGALGFRWRVSRGGTAPLPTAVAATGWVTHPPTRMLQVPLWFIALVLAIVPLRSAVLYHRIRRAGGIGFTLEPRKESDERTRGRADATPR